MTFAHARASVFLVISFATAPLAVTAAYGDGGLSHEFDATMAYFRVQPGYNLIGGLGLGYRGVGYGQSLTPWLEISIRARFSASANTDQTQGRTTFESTLGPTFNFNLGAAQGLADAFFISLGGGLNYTSINSIVVPNTFYSDSQVYSVNPAVSFEIGKRFAVLPNVSLKPSLAITWEIGNDLVDGASTATPAFSINPIEVSIVF